MVLGTQSVLSPWGAVIISLSHSDTWQFLPHLSSPQACTLPLGKLRLDEARALALLCDFWKITSLLWANEGINLEAHWVSSDPLESVFRCCGLKRGALECFHSVTGGLGLASAWVVCVVVWEAGFGWQSAGPGPGDAHTEFYLCVNFQPQITHKALLGICLPPLRPPTHFTFVREKLEEPDLPFLTSATPGTFLGQNRVKVTTERRINPARQSSTFPPFDTKWCIPGPSPYS